MTNSPGRLPQGHPLQPTHPDDRQPAPNGHPPQNAHHPYQQPAYQAPPGYEQSHQPPQSWPPQDPQGNWSQQPVPSEQPQYGDQYWNEAHHQAPVQPSYAQQPPVEQVFAEALAQSRQGQYPAAYPAAQQPADPYRYPNETGAVAEDPYSQPTLGVGGANGGLSSLSSRLPPVGHQHGSPFAQPGLPTAEELAADLSMGHAGAADYGAVDQHLRGPTFDDWSASVAAEQAGYAYPAAPQQGQPYPGAGSQGYPDPGVGYAPYSHEAPGLAGQDQWAQQLEAGYAEAGYQQGAFGAHELTNGWPQGPDGDLYQQPAAGAPDVYAPSGAPELSAYGQSGAVNNDVEYEDDEEEDAPRSGTSRLVLVSAVLAGVIAIGAGLAYGYNTFLGKVAKISSGPPLVRGDGRANKARPTDPGGRKIEQRDSKFMDRISEEARATTGQSDGGARRVPTVMIGRDGRVVNQGAAPVPYGAPPAEPAVIVPGLTVVDGFAGQRAALQEQQGQTPPKTAGQPLVIKPPKTAGNALSPVRPAVVNKKPEPPKAQPKPQVPQAVAKATPPKSIPTTTPRKPAASAAPAAPSTSSGGGYVAVLASVPVSGNSRLEALKTFADIQQNFGSVLKNRTPDVREANLGAKGRYHRLMVGPPSSAANANALCKELKSAGYPSCWITAY